MPESAEVRLMMDQVVRLLQGRVLSRLEIRSGKYLTNKTHLDRSCLTELQANLPRRAVAVRTRGKFGWIEFDNGTALSITFGMSGAIRLHDEAHCHIAFYVDGAETPAFYYCDPRNFGNLKWMRMADLVRKVDKDLGIDILDDLVDQATVIKQWRKYGKGKSDNIVVALMNQKILAGVGNYIKSETLYATRTSPMAKVSQLSDHHLYSMYLAAHKIAREAYEARGASLYTYRGSTGEKGDFQDLLKVYNRSHDPEGRAVIKLDTPDKRTTYYVPEYQTILSDLETSRSGIVTDGRSSLGAASGGGARASSGGARASGGGARASVPPPPPPPIIPSPFTKTYPSSTRITRG